MHPPMQEPDVPVRAQLANGVELHYIERGRGQPLLLLHGGMGDCHSWAAQMQAFAQRFRVIAVSRRHSYPNRFEEPLAGHSVDRDVDDLLAFERLVHASPAHVVATSYGALVALIYALRYPDKVLSLVLAEPPLHQWACRTLEGASLFAEFLKEVWLPAGQAFARGDDHNALRILVNGMWGRAVFDSLSPDRAQAAFRNSRAMRALTLAQEPFPNPPRAAVAQLAIPMLLLSGERSSALHRCVVEEVASVVPFSNQVVIGGAGHGAPVENPDGFNAAVLDFLTGQATSGPGADLKVLPASYLNERIRNVPTDSDKARAAVFGEFPQVSNVRVWAGSQSAGRRDVHSLANWHGRFRRSLSTALGLIWHSGVRLRAVIACRRPWSSSSPLNVRNALTVKIMGRSLPGIAASAVELSFVEECLMRSRLLPNCRLAGCAAALFAIAAQVFAAPYFWSTGAFTSVGVPNPMEAPDTLTVQAGGVKTFYALTWTNKSFVSHAADPIYGGSATLNNDGLWDLQGDSATFVYNAGNQPTFVNTGTLRKSAGTLNNFGSWAFVSNAGAVDAQTGVLNFNGNAVVINSGTSFRGAGTVRMSGGATFNGGFVADNLELAGGAFTGNAAQLTGGVTGTGNVRWTGGQFRGNWQLVHGHTLTVLDGGAKQLVAADVVNNGTVLWQSANDLFGASSTLTNNGLFEVRTNSGLVYFAGNRPVLVNNGTLRAAAGATLTNLSFGLVNNGGTLDAAAGGTIVYGGDNNVFNAGTKFTGAGQNIVASNARFVDDFTAANLVLQAGIFYGGDGIAADSKAIAKGATSWTGGQLRGSWELGNGHTLTVLDGGAKQLVATDVVNNGTVLWQSTNDLFGASSTLTNNGLFEVQTNSGLIYFAGNRPVFVNNGRFVKSGGAGETSLASFGLTNNGTIDVQTGSIRLPTGFTNTGTLMGVGDFTTSVLTNAGHVAPGSSPGTLELNGDYIQTAAGSLDIDLASSSFFDMFLITGTAHLDGLLALNCWAACSFNVGDSFVILDSIGDLTGVFGSTSWTGFSKDFRFDLIYDYSADLVRLQVLSNGNGTVPEPATWMLMLFGLAAIGGVARRRL